MAYLRAIAPRIALDSKPFTDRTPVWDASVFYHSGSIVDLVLVDATDPTITWHNFYVNSKDVQPQGNVPQNNNDWILWSSTDPSLTNFYNDSDVYAAINNANGIYEARFLNLDSDMTALRNAINHVISIDSEIRLVSNRIDILEEENIIDRLFDSEARHNRAIVWDSDSNKFTFQPFIRSLNGILPDSTGNISYTFTKTKTGTRDQRPDSDLDGVQYVVTGDSDSDFNGTSSIYANGVGWIKIIGLTEAENDARYINIAGDTMNGPLLLKRHPVEDSEVSTKGYIDTVVVGKENKTVTVDTLVTLSTTAYVEDTNYFVVEDASLWRYHGGALVKFVIPAETVFNPTFTHSAHEGAGRFTLKTYNFSNTVPGIMILTKNGVAEPFVLQANVTGGYSTVGTYTSVIMSNSGDQSFQILLTATYDPSSTYLLTFTSHDSTKTQINLAGSKHVIQTGVNRSLNFGTF